MHDLNGEILMVSIFAIYKFHTLDLIYDKKTPSMTNFSEVKMNMAKFDKYVKNQSHYH